MIFSAYRKSPKTVLYSSLKSVFKLTEYCTVRGRAFNLHLPLACPPLLYLHTWTICAFLGLSGVLFTGLVTLEHRDNLTTKSAALGLYASLEGKTAPCSRSPSFLPGGPTRSCMGRHLVLFGLQFSLTAFCSICDWFYFTFSQNVVIKWHLENRKKKKCMFTGAWAGAYLGISSGNLTSGNNNIKLMESFSEAGLFCTFSNWGSESLLYSLLVGGCVNLQATFRLCSN